LEFWARWLTLPSPFISYDSVNFNGTRLAKLQSFVDFDSDVKADTLPQYAHMSPDMLNDGHNTSLAYAANWTQSFLAPLLANEQFMSNTLILLTYDESETYSMPNRIVSILLGGAVPDSLRGTKDSTFYTHYSILSTLENNWDLPNLGRYDVGANVFELVANQAGYTNHPPANMATINNSLSYGGFLNSDSKAYKPIPPPNLRLIGAGGQTVDASVQSAWAEAASELSPYDGSGNTYDGGNGQTDENSPVYKAQGLAPSSTAAATSPDPSPTTTKESGAMRMRKLYINWAGVGFAASAVAAFVL
jgi:acid phosphatase